MANKKQSNDLKASLDIIRRINWLDGIYQLPNDVDEKLLDQCSDIIQEFLEGNELSSIKIRKSKVQKRQVKKTKRKLTSKISQVYQTNRTDLLETKRLKSKVKKNTQPFSYSPAFPCFRPFGPINCPKNKLPMPRDLWYRIVYSQALEAFVSQKHPVKPLQSLSKRKHQEDESEMKNLDKNKSNNTNSRQQQTMNAAISSTANQMIELDVKINDQLHKSEWNHENLKLETLPLEIECKHNQSNLTHSKIDFNIANTILSTQSAHIELLHRPKIYRGISADAKLERNIPSPSVPSIISNKELNSAESIRLASSIQPSPTNLSVQEVINKITDDNLRTDISVLFDHPLINQLFEYYNLENIPRLHLFKQLTRRLKHVRQSLKMMSSSDIELKLEYKRDALIRKRQTPVQSLTKDERIAMAELELNVYEYVQALDESSSKSFHINDNNVLQTEQLLSISPILPSSDTGATVVRSAIASESSIVPSVSTFNTVQPSALSESTARLSTITQFSEQTDKLASWTHPLEPNLMTMFDSFTPSQKLQIHKQLARRYEHICKKAQELSRTQLQTQINSKTKALEQSRRLSHPNKNELLRIAELELSLFELRNEQTQRNQFDQ